MIRYCVQTSINDGGNGRGDDEKGNTCDIDREVCMYITVCCCGCVKRLKLQDQETETKTG